MNADEPVLNGPSVLEAIGRGKATIWVLGEYFRRPTFVVHPYVENLISAGRVKADNDDLYAARLSVIS